MKKEDSTKDKYMYIDEKIKNRESWFKIAVVGFIILVISWKILQSSIKISNFDFNELLTLILAIFSISLSIVFYFKATETSNNFYDNSYQFTKEISEVLGRIEAGFGERLRHLDEGYSDLREKVHYSGLSREETEKEIDNEEENLSKAEKERNQLIEEIIEKAEMQDQEKQAFIEKLKDKENEIDELKEEIRELKDDKYTQKRYNIIEEIPEYLKKFLLNEVIPNIRNGRLNDVPASYIKNKFNYMKKHYDYTLLKKLRYHGILDKDYDLTLKGISILKYYANTKIVKKPPNFT